MIWIIWCLKFWVEKEKASILLNFFFSSYLHSKIYVLFFFFILKKRWNYHHDLRPIPKIFPMCVDWWSSRVYAKSKHVFPLESHLTSTNPLISLPTHILDQLSYDLATNQQLLSPFHGLEGLHTIGTRICVSYPRNNIGVIQGGYYIFFTQKEGFIMVENLHEGEFKFKI